MQIRFKILYSKTAKQNDSKMYPETMDLPFEGNSLSHIPSSHIHISDSYITANSQFSTSVYYCCTIHLNTGLLFAPKDTIPNTAFGDQGDVPNVVR